MLPSRDGGVVIALIRGVPAEHHIAKSKTTGWVRLCGAFEFVNVQVLAAQNAVDVADGHFDFLGAAFFNCLKRRVYFGGGHDQSYANLQFHFT